MSHRLLHGLAENIANVPQSAAGGCGHWDSDRRCASSNRNANAGCQTGGEAQVEHKAAFTGSQSAHGIAVLLAQSQSVSCVACHGNWQPVDFAVGPDATTASASNAAFGKQLHVHTHSQWWGWSWWWWWWWSNKWSRRHCRRQRAAGQSEQPQLGCRLAIAHLELIAIDGIGYIIHTDNQTIICVTTIAFSCLAHL